MELPERVATALRSLNGALDLLEAAAERRVLADASRGDLEAEVAVLQEDRMRLAEELDGRRAEQAALIATNAEVAERLDRVTDVLQAMLAESDQPAYDSAEADGLPGSAPTWPR